MLISGEDADGAHVGDPPRMVHYLKINLTLELQKSPGNVISCIASPNELLQRAPGKSPTGVQGWEKKKRAHVDPSSSSSSPDTNGNTGMVGSLPLGSNPTTFFHLLTAFAAKPDST